MLIKFDNYNYNVASGFIYSLKGLTNFKYYIG